MTAIRTVSFEAFGFFFKFCFAKQVVSLFFRCLLQFLWAIKNWDYVLKLFLNDRLCIFCNRLNWIITLKWHFSHLSSVDITWIIGEIALGSSIIYDRLINQTRTFPLAINIDLLNNCQQQQKNVISFRNDNGSTNELK